jgi:hypothetical protein
MADRTRTTAGRIGTGIGTIVTGVITGNAKTRDLTPSKVPEFVSGAFRFQNVPRKNLSSP